MSKGNVDAIINCKNWSKSNNFAFWVMSALLRLHTSDAFTNLAESMQTEISAKVTNAVDYLRKAEKLN